MLLSEIKNVVRTMIKNKNCDINLCLEGHQGIGKTEILKQVAEECGWNYISIYCAQTSTEDLLGMPRVVEDGDGFKTEFARPVLFPDKENTIFVLEEINRAPSEVQQAVLQLLTDRKIGNYKLPKNTIICACINPANGVYQTQELDSVFINRMVKIKAETSPKEFISYAQSQGVRNEIIKFISTLNREEEKIYFTRTPDETTIGKPLPSPRTWMMANKILNLGINDKDVVLAMLCGALGNQCASRFLATIDTFDGPIYHRDILESYSMCRDRVKSINGSILYKLANDLVLDIKDVHDLNRFKLLYPDGVSNFCEFFMDLCDNDKAVATTMLNKMYIPGNDIFHNLISEYTKLTKSHAIFDKISRLSVK